MSTKKEKVRRMKVSVSCKRKGEPAFAYQVEWDAPESKALHLYKHYEQCLRAMLKADGIGE